MKTTFRSIFSKAALATAALGGFLLFAGAPGAKANDWDDCHRRVVYNDWRYHERLEARERAAYYRHEWREHHRYRNDRYGGDWDRR